MDLAERAKEIVGGPANLARLYKVSLPAASAWGRIRPIPRHVRPWIEELVRTGGRPPAAADIDAAIRGARPAGEGKRGAAGTTASYISGTWQAALEPCLADSPLAGRTLPELELLGGEENDRAWAALTSERKAELRKALRRLAHIAGEVEASLPKEMADAVNRELALQVVQYIDATLGGH